MTTGRTDGRNDGTIVGDEFDLPVGFAVGFDVGMIGATVGKLSGSSVLGKDMDNVGPRVIGGSRVGWNVRVGSGVTDGDIEIDGGSVSIAL